MVAWITLILLLLSVFLSDNVWIVADVEWTSQIDRSDHPIIRPCEPHQVWHMVGEHNP